MAENTGKAYAGGVELRLQAEAGPGLVPRLAFQSHLILTEIPYGETLVTAGDVSPCGDVSPDSASLADETSAVGINLRTSRPKVGGLTRWQERLAKEVIDRTLVEGIGMTELASRCGLRTSQFAHGFKRSTGISPYQWLVRRRIELAKELIIRGVHLPEVALACGFADQSHMIRTFRRIVGTTPGAWLKLARG